MACAASALMPLVGLEIAASHPHVLKEMTRLLRDSWPLVRHTAAAIASGAGTEKREVLSARGAAARRRSALPPGALKATENPGEPGPQYREHRQTCGANERPRLFHLGPSRPIFRNRSIALGGLPRNSGNTTCPKRCSPIKPTNKFLRHGGSNSRVPDDRIPQHTLALTPRF